MWTFGSSRACFGLEIHIWELQASVVFKLFDRRKVTKWERRQRRREARSYALGCCKIRSGQGAVSIDWGAVTVGWRKSRVWCPRNTFTEKWVLWLGPARLGHFLIWLQDFAKLSVSNAQRRTMAQRCSLSGNTGPILSQSFFRVSWRDHCTMETVLWEVN